MKIRGIAGANHPTLKKGDPIPLTPEEKLCSMAKEHISTNCKVGYKNIPIMAKVVGKVTVSPGREVKGKSEAPQYSGIVEVTYRPLRMEDDRLHPLETKKIKVHCKDCKNDIGIPDLAPVEITVM